MPIVYIFAFGFRQSACGVSKGCLSNLTGNSVVVAHAGISGAEKFSIFCTIPDTLHDIHTSHMSKAGCNSCAKCSKCYAMDCLGTYITHVQSCDVTRVQSATQWTASVHTLHMPKPNVTRVQSATQWTASVHTLHT